MRKVFSAVVAALTFASVASAQAPVGTFGSQPGITWGGTGIPNNAVQTNSNAASTGITLALSVSQRCGMTWQAVYACDGAPITDNGAGTFYALAGTGNVTPSPANPYANWNFNWYIGGQGLQNHSVKLTWDFNPAPNAGSGPTTTSPLGGFGFYPAGTQNSWNLGMDFLDVTTLLPTFDPNAVGEYAFKLEAFDARGNSVAVSSILVNTSTTVPEPSTYVLMASGLAALGFMARRRKQQAASVVA